MNKEPLDTYSRLKGTGCGISGHVHLFYILLLFNSEAQHKRNTMGEGGVVGGRGGRGHEGRLTPYISLTPLFQSSLSSGA